MDENLHKDNLEEFFKNSFNDENIEPSDDHWDVPSNDVWAGIDESINPVVPPATNSYFNLKWLLAAAASVLIIGLVCYNLSLQRKVNTLTQTIENQSKTIENLKKASPEKEIANNPKSNLEKANSESRSGNVESLSNLPLNNDSPSNLDQTSLEKEEEIVSNPSKSQQKNTVQNNKHPGKSDNNSQLLNTKNDYPENQLNNEIANGQIEN